MSDRQAPREDDLKAYYDFLDYPEIELRAIDPRKEKPLISRHVHSFDEFLKFCQEHNGKYNLYAGINPRMPGGTRAKHVKTVCIIPLDIDAIRPDKGEPATDVELEACRIETEKLYEELRQKYGDPLLIMSGNGYQLLWKITQPIELNDDNGKHIEDKIKGWIRQVQKVYMDLDLDQVGDLPRIMKIPGNMSVKGTNTPERPHRMARIEKRPGETKPTLREDILKITIEEKPKTKQTPRILQENNPDRLKRVLEFDSKFKRLYEGDISEYNGDRSRAEMALADKAVYYSFDVGNILSSASIGKWYDKATGESYRKLTEQKAYEKTDRFQWNNEIPSNDVAPHICNISIDDNGILLKKEKKEICNTVTDGMVYSGGYDVGLVTTSGKNDIPREKCTLSDVHAAFNYLKLPDKEPIDLVMGFHIAHKMLGDPVWLMLIAAPSSAKTEILRATLSLDYVVQSDTITKNTLINGSCIPLDIRYGKKVDLAFRLHGKVWTLLDFSTILETQRDERSAIFSQLRNIYDGFISKSTGATGEAISYGSGKNKVWQHKIKKKSKDEEDTYETRSVPDPQIHTSFITACTPIIDIYYSQHALLGDRFLLYRLPDVKDYEVMEKLDEDQDIDKHRANAAKVICEYINGITIRDVEISKQSKDKLKNLVAFATRMRTPVVVDRKDNTVETIPSKEGPGRMYKMFLKLFKSLMHLDEYTEDMALRVISKIAMSCASQTRMKIVKEMHLEKEHITTWSLCPKLRIGNNAIYREMRALYALEVVELKTEPVKDADDKTKYKDTWILSNASRVAMDCIREPSTEQSTIPDSHVKGKNYPNLIDRKRAACAFLSEINGEIKESGGLLSVVRLKQLAVEHERTETEAIELIEQWVLDNAVERSTDGLFIVFSEGVKA